MDNSNNNVKKIEPVYKVIRIYGEKNIGEIIKNAIINSTKTKNNSI
jgi:hypothetical protein